MVAERLRGVAGGGERLGVVGLGAQRRLGVLERALRVPDHHQQAGEMDPQRRVAGVGGDRGLERGGHGRVDGHEVGLPRDLRYEPLQSSS